MAAFHNQNSWQTGVRTRRPSICPFAPLMAASMSCASRDSKCNSSPTTSNKVQKWEMASEGHSKNTERLKCLDVPLNTGLNLAKIWTPPYPRQSWWISSAWTFFHPKSDIFQSASFQNKLPWNSSHPTKYVFQTKNPEMSNDVNRLCHIDTASLVTKLNCWCHSLTPPHAH